MRLGPVRAARAEAALLAGDLERAQAEVMAVRDLAVARGTRWQRGEIAWLLWQTGDRAPLPDDIAEPYALQMAGDPVAAAAIWRALGCPYEEARALAVSSDPGLVHQAITTFEELGAQPAIASAVHHLRDLGVRNLPVMRRGPVASTRANPAGLTQREIEVLALVVEGLRNTDIAARLYLTPKTVSHHLTSIFSKLGVATRTEAARAAVRLGIQPEI